MVAQSEMVPANVCPSTPSSDPAYVNQGFHPSGVGDFIADIHLFKHCKKCASKQHQK